MPRYAEDDEWNEEIEQSPVKRRTNHIRRCSAFGCTSKGYRLLIAGERVQYFPFPLFDRVLCQRWAAALKIPQGTPYEKLFVCSKHFRTADYKARADDTSKKSLRRTALPSLESVVKMGPAKPKKEVVDHSSEETDEEEINLKEITTLVSKDGADAFTMVVVKDTVKEEGDDVDDIPPKMFQTKKVPLRCEDLLDMGPPYPWRHLGLTNWVNNRLSSHEEQLMKTRDAAATTLEACELMEDNIQELISTVAHYTLKSFMGRVNVTNRVKQLLEQ